MFEDNGQELLEVREYVFPSAQELKHGLRKDYDKYFKVKLKPGIVPDDIAGMLQTVGDIASIVEGELKIADGDSLNYLGLMATWNDVATTAYRAADKIRSGKVKAAKLNLKGIELNDSVVRQRRAAARAMTRAVQVWDWLQEHNGVMEQKIDAKGNKYEELGFIYERDALTALRQATKQGEILVSYLLRVKTDRPAGSLQARTHAKLVVEHEPEGQKA